MGFHFSTLALELTSHYVAAWGTYPTAGLTADQIAKKRGENGERLVMLSKTAFTWTLSAMEYAAKRATDAYPGAIATKKKGKTLYLADIVQFSPDAGLIDATKRRLWFGVNTIRNKVVHNNGYGDGAAKWEFSKDLTITMEDGKMLEGTVMTFPRLLAWIVAEYADWCERFLSKAKPSS